MNSLIDNLFGGASFVPHGYCLLWRPDLVAMHVISDGVTAASYLTIPMALAVFVRNRSDLYYKNIFWLFVAFIVACGMTHIFDIFTLWYPAYEVQGMVKAIAALLSAATAIQLWPIIPQALALPSPAALRQANEALESRIRENERINCELTAIRDELEARVEARTAELAESNRRIAEREAYFRDLYRTTPIMMHSVDRDGLLIEINDFWAERMGYSHEEVIGRPAREFIAEERREQMAQEFSPAFWRTGRVDRFPCILARKDGTKFETEISAIAVPDGRNMRAYAVVVDVSAREAAEARLREKARQLERANEGLTQFAYVASHDLQEPLRKIVTFSRVLGDAVAEAKTDDIDYAASVMRDSALRARQLVGDLLAFSQSANAEFHMTQFELNDIVGGVLNDLSETIKATNAVVKVDTKDVIVNADRAHIAHLIQNLLSNALKYHKETEPPYVHITASESSNSRVELRIDDKGIGFDPAYAEMIFEPFKRLHTRAEFPGSGIGLAICKTIADRHGWSIFARSSLGNGASFVVSVPGAA